MLTEVLTPLALHFWQAYILLTWHQPDTTDRDRKVRCHSQLADNAVIILLETANGTKLLSSDVIDLNSAACEKTSVNGIFGCLGAHGVGKLSKSL